MFGRRILVLVAVLMGLTALAASLTPPPQPVPRNRTATGPIPTPQAAEPQPVAAARTVTARLSEKGRPRTITARTGDMIELDVSGNTPDTVVIDDLAVSEPVAPDSPRRRRSTPTRRGATPSCCWTPGAGSAPCASRARADVGRRALLGVVGRDEASAAVAPRAGDLVALAAEVGDHASGAAAGGAALGIVGLVGRRGHGPAG